MVSFFVIDMSLLVLFILFASVFLYRKRRNLKKEGSLFLYKTSWGIKLIDYIGKKYQRTLKLLSYISISIGYVLMAGIIYLMGNSVYLYLTTEIAKTLKAPPIAPLIPYFPKLFGLQSFFPDFFFVYFIVAILIVATAHEFSHGIFARRFGIRIKSTGFAFFKYLPAFFGAFVEQDDKQMNQSKKFAQMSVLSAGVFANVIVAIGFYFLLFLFFTATFIPSGIQFNIYSQSLVNVEDISSINGLSVTSYEELLNLTNDSTKLNRISTKEMDYFGTREGLFDQRGQEQIILSDSPALEYQLGKIITEIDGEKITSLEKLKAKIGSYSPGDEIEIKTIKKNNTSIDKLKLGEHPEKEGVAWLGVRFDGSAQGTFSKFVSTIFPSYKKPFVYYKPKSEAHIFIKNLIWWVFIINILVALFNMLPLGILDGGRFFYLTILGITGSENLAKKSFRAMTYFILLLFFLLVIKWLFSLF